MKKSINIILLSLFISIPLNLSAQEKIIFDTDFGGDADDLGALAILHNYIDKDMCDLLAIMSWSTEKYVIPALDAVNRYYGHPDIPLSIRSKTVDYRDWNYNKILADNFPYKKTHDEVSLATDLYRKILSEHEDKSITIVTVGPLKNIMDLINSEADNYSELHGKELINKKVKRFVIMGGKFPSGEDEWNFDGGMPGVTKFVLDNLDVPVVFSGFEIGVEIKTGEIFNNINRKHPLYAAFEHFSINAPWMKEYYKGKILDNSSYDQTAVLYAIENGIGEYWDIIQDGKCIVNDTGDSYWKKGEKSKQSYLILKEDPEEMARIIENRMLGE